MRLRDSDSLIKAHQRHDVIGSLSMGLLSILILLGCEDSGANRGSAEEAMSQDIDVTSRLDQDVTDDLEIHTADMLVSDDLSVDQGESDVDAAPIPMPMWEPTTPETVELPACGQAQAVSATVVSEGAADERGITLSARARIFEKIFHAFHTYATGLNVELGVVDEEARAAIEAFATDDTVWTLDDAGLSYEGLISNATKAAGLYGGVGIAADAFRYKVLIEEGAPCEEIEYARSALLKDLEALHIATAITGVRGVIARALGNTLLPGAGQAETVPLFDEEGRPFPTEKTNGTWREDQSGDYPTMVWEDSCSRDMYVGWALAYASMWEAIRTDPTIPEMLKLRLRRDAHDLVHSLMQVGEEGYDLEIRDADGRMTYHGILNENSVDRNYVQGAPNGFNGILASGIVGGLAWVSGDPVQLSFVEEELIDTRGLLNLAKTSLLLVDRGVGSNYSAYNMAFTGAWLAARYLRRAADRSEAREAVRTALYQRGERDRQPVEQSQALYHLVFVQSELGAHAFGRDEVTRSPLFDRALESTRRDLFDFPTPPFFGREVINCDEQEIESDTCIAENGLELPLLGPVGWNDDLVAAVPLPLSIRPISNYYWRSNPYAVNGGASPLQLLPGSDFRWVYWAGRSLTITP